jgi:hypothetical protein
MVLFDLGDTLEDESTMCCCPVLPRLSQPSGGL